MFFIYSSLQFVRRKMKLWAHFCRKIKGLSNDCYLFCREGVKLLSVKKTGFEVIVNDEQ